MHRFLEKIYGYFVENELQSLYLLAPIIFAVGVIIFFNLSFEPDITYSAIAFAFAVAVTLISYKLRRFFLLTLFAGFFIAGFFFANLRVETVTTKFLEKNERAIWVRGDVIKLDREEKQITLTLNNLDLWQPDIKRFPSEKTPDKIRVTVRTKMAEEIRVGDRVAFKSFLQPPATRPVFPGGYDFTRIAFFNNIGAIGYAINDVKLFQKKQPTLIDRFQDYYYDKVKQDIHDHDLAGMIVSQITADRVEISDETTKKVRSAGLSHLLAISGMNMSVVMAWLFFLSRSLFALFPRIALKHDTKKLSIFICILIGFIYLLITGMPVSAIRAFLMVLIFFTAILIDRFSVSLQPVAFAALAILMVRPEEILSPGFQLSFAAVIGLIGLYELYDRYLKNGNEKSFITKWSYAFAGIVISTLFTSMATAPFSIMHFGTFQNYGVISNMIGVPVVSIFVLPFAFLAIPAIPLGIEKPFLKVAEFGSRIIRDTSYYISSKEHSVTYLADIPNYFIGFIALGFLVLFIFKGRIRWLGIPLIISGYYLITIKPVTPDFVINGNATIAAMKQDDGSYRYYGANRQSFALYQFNSKLGVAHPDFIKTNDNCDKHRCIYKNILFGNAPAKKDCEKFDYIINTGSDELTCAKTRVIARQELKDHGTHIFYLGQNRLVTAEGSLSARAWNIRPDTAQN